MAYLYNPDGKRRENAEPVEHTGDLPRHGGALGNQVKSLDRNGTAGNQQPQGRRHPGSIADIEKD